MTAVETGGTGEETREDVLAVAREQVLERGVPLDEAQILRVLRTGDEVLPDLLALAHEVRMKWCGPEVEVEGIVSIKTGGCPEDCHFCSQSGQFTSPVRSVWLNIPELVKAAEQTAATMQNSLAPVAAVCSAALTSSGMFSHTERTGEVNCPLWLQKWQSSGQPQVFSETMPSTSTSGPHHFIRTSWASASRSGMRSSGSSSTFST